MSQKLLKIISLYINCSKNYSIEPPDWLGGRNILFKSGKHKFPEHTKTLEERLNELRVSKGTKIAKNLGTEVPAIKTIKSDDILKTLIHNKKNIDLEKQSRLLTLLVPLEEIEIEDKSHYMFNVCSHYSIFKDLFNGDFFYPVMDLNIAYPFDATNFTPVYFGNRIVPSEARDIPVVEYNAVDKDQVFSLILVSPDSNVFHTDKDVLHWMVTNIKGNDLNSGIETVKYLQPISPLGTGYHRLVFLLFQHKNNRIINFDLFKLKSENRLEDRSFSNKDFCQTFGNDLIPVGLSFFQSSWDSTVRDVFHKQFGIEEPRYEYKHPVPYHPPPIKYPHRQPFDRYFDRYRDKKDLSEEVLKIKLSNNTVLDGVSSNIDEYESIPKLLMTKCKYPLVHQHNKSFKPSWLKRRENIMFRKLEQFKQLND